MSLRALIVEDGSGVNIVTAARSLGRAGWQVGLGVPDAASRASRSRYVSRVHPVPRPEQGLTAFTAGVNAAIRAGSYDVVFPGDDVEMLALSAVRAEISARVPYPAHEVVLRAVDKLGLTESARTIGLSTPRTEPATSDALAAWTGPVLVKSRLHWTPGAANVDRHLPVRLCTSRAEAQQRVAEIEASGGSALLQEPLAGELIAFSTVIDHAGQLRAACQQRTTLASLRRTSVRAVTTDVDDRLQGQISSLLADLGWFGLANLQFIRPPDGPPRLIDFNGRYYGSLALAVAAGADLPALWAALAVDTQPATRSMARPGVRFHAMEEDLHRARRQRRGGLVRDVLGTLAYAPGATHATLSARDPGPTVALLSAFTTRSLQRISRSRLPAGQEPGHQG